MVMDGRTIDENNICVYIIELNNNKKNLFLSCLRLAKGITIGLELKGS